MGDKTDQDGASAAAVEIVAKRKSDGRRPEAGNQPSTLAGVLVEHGSPAARSYSSAALM
jgi:hypothetical protein